MVVNGVSRQLLVFSFSAFLAIGQAFACGGTSCPCDTLLQTVNAIETQNLDAESALYTHLQLIGDQDFLRIAMEDSATKVLLGQLALKKSQREDLKQFARKLIQDQIELSQQVLERVGKPLGVEEEKDLSKKDKESAAKLLALSGTQFDDEFLKTMLKDEKQDLKKFGDEIQLAVDSRVQLAARYDKNLASQHLESLQKITAVDSAVAENSPTILAEK